MVNRIFKLGSMKSYGQTLARHSAFLEEQHIFGNSLSVTFTPLHGHPGSFEGWVNCLKDPHCDIEWEH